MREIKFRAWDRGYKFMTHKVLVGNTDSKDGNYTAYSVWIEPEFVDYEREPGWMNFDEHSNIILMQYTGLSDKNGVEIYEGDIVRYRGSICSVKWQISECRFSLVKSSGFEIYKCDYTDFEKCEVIGNIHQNGELLNESQ